MKYRNNTYRCPKWNYCSPGSYFITINTKYRSLDFGDVIDGEMVLNDIGIIVDDYWQIIPMRFPFVSLDEYIIMPDHVHGILHIGNKNDCRGVPVERPYNHQTLNHQTPNHQTPNHQNPNKNHRMSKISPRAESISVIIRNFKGDCTKHIRPINPEFQWQRNFHDRIIRNEHELHAYQKYIRNNPKNW